MKFYLFVLFIVNIAICQTESWRLTWDANPDSDNVMIYEVYRSNQPNASTKIAEVSHPTTLYQDESLQKGVEYFYRLIAVNHGNFKSGFSEEVSASIPDISNFPQLLILPSDTTIYINDLNNLVTDADHNDNQLTWSVTGNSQLQVMINTNSIEISTPEDWDSSESLTFTCTDLDEFSDIASLQILSGDMPPPINPNKFLITVEDIDASTEESDNSASNTIDNNLSTRWSAQGDGEWIRYDLNSPVLISYMKIAFYLGDQRIAYFDIQVSNDNINWRNILVGAQSSGQSLDHQIFDFEDVTAEYIRYLGHENSSNHWNSLTEIEIWGSEGNMHEVIKGLRMTR